MAKKIYLYAFILGHVPDLSKFEIEQSLRQLGASYNQIFNSDSILVLETSQGLDVLELQKKLGGTVKIAQIVYKASVNEVPQACQNIVFKRLKDLKIKNKKFQFGFSYYGQPFKELQKIGLDIKRQLKDQKYKTRFVVSKDNHLSSVIVKKEKLINQGVDLVIIEGTNGFYLGFSQTVQDFKSYSVRDYGRPDRDDFSGMLPPKLARMLINISRVGPDQVILDPFCGSGTIIQEALLLGHQDIIGSDLSPKAVESTENNIEWLKTKYQKDYSKVQVFLLDARQLEKMIKEQSIDLIITEPYLGPARNLSQAANTIKELSSLYLESFKSFYKVLKPGGQVTIIFPIINNKTIDILGQVEKLGFEKQDISSQARRSIIYSRPKQRVFREIFIFTKQ